MRTWLRVMLSGLLVVIGPAGRPIGAQQLDHLAIRDVGADVGPTWVLLSGLVGGIAGFRALEAALTRNHGRVVTIDPYRLSVDSADVSYDAMARRVANALTTLGVRQARVVGHANGAGVALRVAAVFPHRVESLYLLDAGALSASRGRVLGGSLRLIPMIVYVPGGRALLRRRFIAGIRANAARQEWFDDAAQRAYVDPIVDDIGRAVALVTRLGDAREPHTLNDVVLRVRASVTVILGDAPHPSVSGAAELDALAPLGARLRVVRLPGVGHFPHEEATARVAEELLASRDPVIGARADR